MEDGSRPWLVEEVDLTALFAWENLADGVFRNEERVRSKSGVSWSCSLHLVSTDGMGASFP